MSKMSGSGPAGLPFRTMFFWLVLGCSSSTSDTSGVDPVLDISLAAAPALDPLAGPALTWSLAGADAVPDAPGEIRSATGDVVRSKVLPNLGWDGTNEAGNLLPTGAYSLVVGSGDSERMANFEVVRAGLLSAYAEDDAGVTATRVPLYWHLKRHAQDPTLPFVAIDAMDDSGGVTPLPDVGEGLNIPDAATAEPVAYTYDSRPIVTVTLGAESVLGAANLGAVELHVVAEGWTVLDDTALVDGGTVTLQANEPLGTTLGVSEAPIELGVVAKDASGVDWTIATMNLPWRAYRLLDSPTWEAEGDKYAPWVAAVDPALRALEGTAPQRDAVLDGLVRWIYEDGGLTYDTRYGASAYTIYQQNDWTRASFDMTGFLSRKYGIIVNCTDCAGIVVGYGNMLGAPVDYAIIGWNFDLNYILAIGGTDYTHCPFGGSGCGFSYHAVSTDVGNDLIWDATLALDGDDDPGSTPNTELLVQSIPADEYLERLAKTTADYVYTAQGTLQ